MSENVFEVDHLGLYYLGRFGDKTHAVTDVSFSMKQGEILGIAGESGCGKSTLVSGLMGMCIPPLYPETGDVRVKNGDKMESLMNRSIEDVRANVLAQQVSMIPQGAFNALNPVRKIKDIAADVLKAHARPGEKQDAKQIYDRVYAHFDRIGMDTKRVLNSFPINLTAGERQRCVIAISTILLPKMVIADEPTSALDVSTQKEVIKMIFDLLDKGIFQSMIFITHELPLRNRGKGYCRTGRQGSASSLYAGLDGRYAQYRGKPAWPSSGGYRRCSSEPQEQDCGLPLRSALQQGMPGLQEEYPESPHCRRS